MSRLTDEQIEQCAKGITSVVELSKEEKRVVETNFIHGAKWAREELMKGVEVVKGEKNITDMADNLNELYRCGELGNIEAICIVRKRQK